MKIDLTEEHLRQEVTVCLPLGALLSIVSMRVVDTPLRMKSFAFGAVAMVAAVLVPAVAGFSMTTLVINLTLAVIGGTFAFEGMLKVWAQESFPTMLRSSAQGSIIAIARIASAALAVGTPALLLSHSREFYFTLAGLSVVGLLVAWVHFSRKASTEFDREALIEPSSLPPQPTPPRGEPAL